MNSRIWKFLKTQKSDDVFHTHVSLFGPKGKFCINRSNTERFWNLYCQTLLENPDMNVGVAEKPQPYLPVLVDVDIKRDMEDSKEDPLPIYSLSHVTKLIEIYQGVLRQVIDDVEDKHLFCILLQKNPYVERRKNGVVTKHGFHLHFPYTFINRIEQETHIIPRVKELVSKNKIFADLGFADSASLIDTSYVSIPWLMYGASKGESKDPYIVTKMYNELCAEISIEQGLKDYVILDKDESEIKMTRKIEFYLPRILSIVAYGREIQDLKTGLPAPMDIRMPRKKRTRQEKLDINFHENMSMVKQYVNMLSRYRANDRNEWMRIGWVLHNIGNGCDEARDIWIDFSRKCEAKFDESECHRHWEGMINKGMSIGSLKYYASLDNPKEYKKLKAENVNRYLQQSLGGSHNDIARVLFEMCGTEFVCADLRNRIWFQYRNHHWCEIEQGIYLRRKISSEVLDRYVEEYKTQSKKLIECEDTGEQAMYKERQKMILKVVNNLKSAPFKNNVMKECMEVFYDGMFLKKLNKNPYLVGFQNGIYDTRTHTFRDGSPDDYISLQMAISYRKFDSSSVEVNQVEDFLMKVFPDKSVREYFMDSSSDVFVGGNHSKIVQVWSGEGDNAKSVTQTLFEKMLGKYAIKLPTALLVGKRTQSSTACPELVRAGNGVRFAVLQEPDQKDVINIGILKELSGNDTFFARGLYKSGGEITPMFKLILICNEPPQLPYGDKAVWNRIRVIPFESTFCSDAPDSFDEQFLEKRFPKDRQFSDKIPGMIEAFAFMLLEHRKHIKSRFEPKKVKMATEGYRKKNDIYRQFIEEIIVVDKKSALSLLEIYGAFKEWFRESLPQQRIPVKNDVLTYFTKAWGNPGRGVKWRGQRLRTIQDDVAEGDAIVFEENELSKTQEDFTPDI